MADVRDHMIDRARDYLKHEARNQAKKLDVEELVDYILDGIINDEGDSIGSLLESGGWPEVI